MTTIATAPPVIGRYFALAPSRDTEEYFALFAADALVEDEGREYRGIDSIRAWRTAVPLVAYDHRHRTGRRRGGRDLHGHGGFPRQSLRRPEVPLRTVRCEPGEGAADPDLTERTAPRCHRDGAADRGDQAVY